MPKYGISGLKENSGGPFRSAARKLLRTKIRAISLAGKCFVYFESALAGKVDTLVSSVLFSSSVAVRLFGGIFQSERTILLSNHRHKIRFQDIVYFKLNK